MEQWGALAALGAAIMWTVNGVIMEKNGAGLDGGALNLGRIILGLLMITAAAMLLGFGALPLSAGIQSWLWLLLSGLIGFALGDTLLVKGFLMIGARLTLLVFSFAPVLTAVLGYVFFGETLSVLNLFGMLLVLLGIAIVIGLKENGGAVPGRAKGLIFAFIASLAQAFGTVASKMGLQEMEPLAATQVRLIGGLLGMGVIFLLDRRWKHLLDVIRSPRGRLTILSGAVLGTLFGVVLSMIAIRWSKAAVASTLMSTMPVLILPISVFILKEKLRPKDLFGAALSLVGSAVLFM